MTSSQTSKKSTYIKKPPNADDCEPGQPAQISSVCVWETYDVLQGKEASELRVRTVPKIENEYVAGSVQNKYVVDDVDTAQRRPK